MLMSSAIHKQEVGPSTDWFEKALYHTQDPATEITYAFCIR